MNKYLIAFFALTVGCDDSNVIPKSGKWSYSNFDYDPNGCNLLPPEKEYPFQLEVIDRDTIELIYEDEEQICVLSMGEFDCETRTEEIDLSVEIGVDAIITEEIRVTGSFSDDMTGTEANTISLSCEGEACADLTVGGDEESGTEGVPMPCTSTRNADISWSE